MKSHVTSIEVKPIQAGLKENVPGKISKQELDALIEAYDSKKVTGCFNPQSDIMTKLKLINSKAIPDKNGFLNDDQFLEVFKLLHKIEYDEFFKEKKSTTYLASSDLRAKFKEVFRYLIRNKIDNDQKLLLLFQQPEIIKNAQEKEYGHGSYLSLSKLINDQESRYYHGSIGDSYDDLCKVISPTELKVMSKVSELLPQRPSSMPLHEIMLDHHSEKERKSYEFLLKTNFWKLVAEHKQAQNLPMLLPTLLALRSHNFALYDRFSNTYGKYLREEPHFCDLSNEWGTRPFYDETPNYDNRINKKYTANILSNENMSCILRHPDEQNYIANALINLHKAMIGLENQNAIEEMIRNMFDTNKKAARWFSSDISQLPIEIIQSHIHLLVEYPSFKSVILYALVKLNELDLAKNQTYIDLLKDNLKNLVPVISVIEILSKAFLRERNMNELLNCVKYIDQNVPLILQKIRLTEDSVRLLFTNLEFCKPKAILAALERNMTLDDAIKEARSLSARSQIQNVMWNVNDKITEVKPIPVEIGPKLQ